MAYNQLDRYHRAFRSYKNELENGALQDKLHRAICRAASSREHLRTSRFRCEVDTDWIEYLEEHLIYLEKAILENRQFILQQGETQLIEKAKRVSKASVEHLAQHSEMITHMPEPGEDLLPDKLYVVENDSNFAVYENRFLYMLLLDLSDFVENKYQKVVEWWNKYISELHLDKEISVGKRKLEFSLSLKENACNDPDTAYDEETAACITRIGELQRSISALLQTSLMKEVSHAPLVKPPIARTNVLKMDPNFKIAVEVYDYLCAYDRDGYTVHEMREDMSRFSEAMEADFAELVAMSSYLTYRYGGRLEERMEQRFEQQNKLLREQEDERCRALLCALKARLAAKECSVEEYVTALEERNMALEQDRNQLNALEHELSSRRIEIYELSERGAQLGKEKAQLEQQLREQQLAAKEQAAAHRREMEQQREQHAAEIAEWQKRYEELNELQLATMAQLRGVRYQQGLMNDEEDYSSKEMLMQLEKERKAFDKLFAAQWKAAKKQIRKKAFAAEHKTEKD